MKQGKKDREDDMICGDCFGMIRICVMGMTKRGIDESSVCWD